MHKLYEGIFTLEGLRLGRVYAIKASDGLTLIDTSIPGAFPRIEKDLKRSGYALSQIKRILLTHAHWDHYGNLAALKEATGAQVYAHFRYESAVIRGEKRPLHPPYSQLGFFDRLVSKAWVQPKLRHTVAVPVDYELKEGDRLDEVLSGLEVVDLPGHSPGQCGFWLAEKGLLFGGDVMMRAPSGRFVLPMVAATPDLPLAKRSILKVAEMNVRTLCPGHGKPLVGEAGHAVSTFARTLRL
ncbi:MAG TPA: MBL fold metallo-hydrolase [Ktedonobacteraceae bacterium]|nr:MBL fold metallo-hydrolase [Ktedonobacteraceae bacterium]